MHIVKIDPVGKPRMTQRDRWKKRPCVVKYWEFKDSLKFACHGVDIRWEPLSITFYIPMPKSWSKKKKSEMYGKPHKQTPDLDNMIKAVKDCLLKEDSGVWYYGEMKKLWSDRGFIVFKGGNDDN